MKQCKYCEEDENLLETTELITSYKEDVFDIQINEDCLYVWCNCGRHQVKQIQYCPMCGRKLGDD